MIARYVESSACTQVALSDVCHGVDTAAILPPSNDDALRRTAHPSSFADPGYNRTRPTIDTSPVAPTIPLTNGSDADSEPPGRRASAQCARVV